MNDQYTRVRSVAVHGVGGHVVEIEAGIGGLPPGFHLAGLPDDMLREARDRVRAAVVNSGLSWPTERIELTLSPATPRAVGSGFDVALACAVLGAAGVLAQSALDEVVLLGELGLDGKLRAVRGVLPCLLAARAAGIRRAIVPQTVLPEAHLVDGIEACGAADLSEVLDYLQGARRPGPHPTHDAAPAPRDLIEVRGQDDAKHALEIAAAGGHHVLLVGPPGAGTTMLAQRFVGLLPRLSSEEALTVAAIQSAAGRLLDRGELYTVPPFVAPHHSSSLAAVLGGGSGIGRPGAVSLAHHGVLFLDDAPEWNAAVLDAVRTPLERGEVRLARVGETVVYPARFQLVLAARPCPCSAAHDRACVCPPATRRRYRLRLTGPLFDRVDVRTQVYPATADTPMNGAENSATVRARVLTARDAAAQRWATLGFRTNAEVPAAQLHTRFALSRQAIRPLDTALRAGQITARGADRALRVAWTLADLAGLERPDVELVERALSMRARPVA